MPNGFTSHWVPPILEERGLLHVTFSFRTHDWFETSAERLTRRVLARAEAGSIFVLHDGEETDEEGDRSVVIDALPGILAGLRARGLRVVGVAELLGIDWRRPAAGAEPPAALSAALALPAIPAGAGPGSRAAAGRAPGCPD
jgi:hypothetical protein